MKQEKYLYFRTQLMAWFAQNHRPLPWKGERNPYFIWLSEIILQQTRVEQGMPYYQRFVAAYPTVTDLADAPEDHVMKLWEGLGYYSRARNLHAAAKYIAYDCEGIFPKTYDEILKIKGVGVYTAAAIASFAYDSPYAVVDGNVYRVLSRYFGIDTPIDGGEGQKLFKALAQSLLDITQPANYNQAIMDFGATQCTPKVARCSSCPLMDSCTAMQQKQVDFLPVKAKKLIKKNRYLHYLVFKKEEQTWIRRREEKDIWQHLYEFPLIETEEPNIGDSLIENDAFAKFFFTKVIPIRPTKISRVYKQQLTHQTIYATFYELEISDEKLLKNSDFVKIFEKEIKNFAFPRLFDWYFQDKSVSLTLF